MRPSYECNTCHSIQEVPRGLCSPVVVSDECQRPTLLESNLEHACAPMLNQATFFCEGCGRPTGEPESVCMPMMIKTSA